jgi:hypothetical protein
VRKSSNRSRTMSRRICARFPVRHCAWRQLPHHRQSGKYATGPSLLPRILRGAPGFSGSAGDAALVSPSASANQACSLFELSRLSPHNPRLAVNEVPVSVRRPGETASGKPCRGAGRRRKPDTAGKAETEKCRKHGQLRGYGRRDALTSGRDRVRRKGLAPRT